MPQQTYTTQQQFIRRAPDNRLPALNVALDGAAMTAYLGPRLSVINAGHGLAVTDVRLLDHKPGQRALIRYELATPAGRENQAVFGKVFADTQQLVRVAQLWQTLWDEVFADGLYCSTPQPLGLIPELSMLAYLPAEGQFLDEVIGDERAGYALELTGRWLAQLHRHPIHIEKKFHLATELTNLAAWAALVAQNYPKLAGLTSRLLTYLQQQAERLPLTTQTPIHKDFHYRHVLVERGVKVIDFDEMRLGDPNFDLAHFCANLHLLAYRQSGSPHALRPLEQQFLKAYSRQTGWNLRSVVEAHRARFTYFYVYTCLKLARQLCLGFGPSPVPTGVEREQQVEMILRQGVGAMING